MKGLFDIVRKFVGTYKQANQEQTRETSYHNPRTIQQMATALFWHAKMTYTQTPLPAGQHWKVQQEGDQKGSWEEQNREGIRPRQHTIGGKRAGFDASTEILYSFLKRFGRKKKFLRIERASSSSCRRGETYETANKLQRNYAAASPRQSSQKILLERMKTEVDSKLRGHQAGLREDRSCTDHIATLHIVIQQSLEWSSSYYANFID